MTRGYLGFGHEGLNPEKVSEKSKLFMRAKTNVDKCCNGSAKPHSTSAF